MPHLPDNERTLCEVYTRVMGYHRPTSAYNIGKQQEHRDRRYFTEGRAALSVPYAPRRVECRASS